MAAEVRIVRVTQVDSLQPTRVGRMDTLVSYQITVGAGADRLVQTDTLRISEDSPTPQRIEQLVREASKLKVQLLGSKWMV